MAPFTTHQVAALLSVSLPTVVNWIKEGRLEAYKTPGGHRRIPPGALAAFCQKFSLPLPDVLSGAETSRKADQKPVILVASFEHDFAELIQDFMQIKAAVPVLVVESALQTGLLLGQNSGGVLVVDQAHTRIDPIEARELLRNRFSVVVLTSTQDDAERLKEQGFELALSRSSEFEVICNVVSDSLRKSTALD